jgi:hypothetical protein
MSFQENYSTHRHIDDRRIGNSWRIWAGLLRIVGSALMLMHIVGCVSQTAVTGEERRSVIAGEKAIVLLNIQCTVDNQPYEAFIKPTFTTESVFLFGLGSFDTVGEPRFVWSRFLSEESRQAGWTYFLLSPGVYYLAVLGPDSSVISKLGVSDSQKYIQEAPRWRLDVPENVKLLYVGTLHLSGKTHGELLFGGKIIRPVDHGEATVRDDHGPASSLLLQYFPDAGEVKNISLQRWHRGESIIIRSHKGGLTK